MKTKAFGYVRVSGKSQIKKDGFPRQKKAIRDYAKKNKLNVVKIYEEKGVSGTLADRPALAEMMVDLAGNGQGVKTIIIEKADRLARELLVQENIFADLRRKGFSLVSALEGNLEDLTGDPTRTLTRQIMGAIAEYDKKMTVQKLRVARDRVRIKTGKCEGRKRYSEKAPEVIESIKILRRKPKGKRRMTYAKVAEALNDRGFKTMTGKTFSGPLVTRILTNNESKIEVK